MSSSGTSSIFNSSSSDSPIVITSLRLAKDIPSTLNKMQEHLGMLGLSTTSTDSTKSGSIRFSEEYYAERMGLLDHFKENDVAREESLDKKHEESSSFSSSDDCFQTRSNPQSFPERQKSASVNNLWRTEAASHVVHPILSKTARERTSHDTNKYWHDSEKKSPIKKKKSPKKKQQNKKGPNKKKQNKKKKAKKTKKAKRKTKNQHADKKQIKSDSSATDKGDLILRFEQNSLWSDSDADPLKHRHKQEMEKRQHVSETEFKENGKENRNILHEGKFHISLKHSPDKVSHKETLSPHRAKILGRIKGHAKKLSSSGTSGFILAGHKKDDAPSSLINEHDEIINKDLVGDLHQDQELNKLIKRTLGEKNHLSPEKRDFVEEMYSKYGINVTLRLLESFSETPRMEGFTFDEEEEENKKEDKPRLKRQSSVTKLALDKYKNSKEVGKTCVTKHGKLITGATLRVSSEEHLASTALTGDQVLSPLEIGDMKTKKSDVPNDWRIPKTPRGKNISSKKASECRDDDQYPISTEDSNSHEDLPVPALCTPLDDEMLRDKKTQMTQKEASAAKLLWLLVGNDYYDVHPVKPRQRIARRIKRTRTSSQPPSRNSAIVSKSQHDLPVLSKEKHHKRNIAAQRRKRSHSIDHAKSSSGRARTYRYSYDCMPCPNSDENQTLCGPWECERSKGVEGRLCLSTRESDVMRDKDSSENRLCHKVLFSVSGGLFTNDKGHAVYRDISGIRVCEDDASVLGAYQCIFTGNRMVLQDVVECQVLGNCCRVNGERNFIRGHTCVVSGFGNVVHVSNTGNDRDGSYPSSNTSRRTTQNDGMSKYPITVDI